MAERKGQIGVGVSHAHDLAVDERAVLEMHVDQLPVAVVGGDGVAGHSHRAIEQESGQEVHRSVIEGRGHLEADEPYDATRGQVNSLPGGHGPYAVREARGGDRRGDGGLSRRGDDCEPRQGQGSPCTRAEPPGGEDGSTGYC